MFNLILILLGLISNPNANTSNCGNGDGSTPTIVQPNPQIPNPGDTGGDNTPIPPRK